MKRCALLLLGVGSLGVLLLNGGCVSLDIAGLDTARIQSAVKVAKAGAHAAKRITPEQEYYIGRSVGATIVSSYKPYDKEKANRYLNVLGQTLAKASDKPETFGGYHFLILDSDEVNAFAAPGGLVFVSRGMLRCCKSEAAVAAVLAHEIGHVQHEHGLGSIKKGRLTSALTILAAESAKTFGSEQLAELTTAFEGTISDITKTLITSGYARKFETEADRAAVTILQRVGYDPNALIDMLREMKTRLKPGGRDFAKTHPDPDDRIAQIRRMLTGRQSKGKAGARKLRFERALGGI